MFDPMLGGYSETPGMIIEDDMLSAGVPAPAAVRIELSAEDFAIIRDRRDRARNYSLKEINGEDEGNLEKRKETYEGYWIGEKPPENTDAIVANYTLVNVQVRESNVCFGPPEFTFDCRNAGHDEELRAAERDFRQMWIDIRAPEETEQSYLDKEIARAGWCAVGWNGRHNRLEIRRVDPRDMWVDPMATCLHKAEYIIERQVLPWRVVVNDSRYSHRHDLKPSHVDKYLNTIGQDTQKVSAETPEGRDQGSIELFHYWGYHPDPSKDVGLIHVVHSDQVQEPLLVELSPFPFEEYPYEMLIAVPRMGELYGLSTVEIGEPQQAQINISTSSITTRSRQLGPAKILADRAAFGQDADISREAVMSGQNEFVFVDATGKSIREVCTSLEHSPLMPETLAAREQNIRDLGMEHAVSDYQRQQMSETPRTAYEVSQLAQQGGARGQRDRVEYEKFCGRLARKGLDLVRVTMPGPRMVRAPMQAVGSPTTVAFDYAELPPGVDIIVVPGSTGLPDRQRDLTQATGALQAAMPFVQMGMVNPIPLLRRLLVLLDVPDIDQIITASVPMMPGGMPGAMPPMTEADMGGEAAIGSPTGQFQSGPQGY